MELDGEDLSNSPVFDFIPQPANEPSASQPSVVILDSSSPGSPGSDADVDSPLKCRTTEALERREHQSVTPQRSLFSNTSRGRSHGSGSGRGRTTNNTRCSKSSGRIRAGRNMGPAAKIQTLQTRLSGHEAVSGSSCQSSVFSLLGTPIAPRAVTSRSQSRQVLEHNTDSKGAEQSENVIEITDEESVVVRSVKIVRTDSTAPSTQGNAHRADTDEEATEDPAEELDHDEDTDEEDADVVELDAELDDGIDEPEEDEDEDLEHSGSDSDDPDYDESESTTAKARHSRQRGQGQRRLRKRATTATMTDELPSMVVIGEMGVAATSAASGASVDPGHGSSWDKLLGTKRRRPDRQEHKTELSSLTQPKSVTASSSLGSLVSCPACGVQVLEAMLAMHRDTQCAAAPSATKRADTWVIMDLPPPLEQVDEPVVISYTPSTTASLGTSSGSTTNAFGLLTSRHPELHSAKSSSSPSSGSRSALPSGPIVIGGDWQTAAEAESMETDSRGNKPHLLPLTMLGRKPNTSSMGAKSPPSMRKTASAIASITRSDGSGSGSQIIVGETPPLESKRGTLPRSASLRLDEPDHDMNPTGDEFPVVVFPSLGGSGNTSKVKACASVIAEKSARASQPPTFGMVIGDANPKGKTIKLGERPPQAKRSATLPDGPILIGGDPFGNPTSPSNIMTSDGGEGSSNPARDTRAKETPNTDGASLHAEDRQETNKKTSSMEIDLTTLPVVFSALPQPMLAPATPPRTARQNQSKAQPQQLPRSALATDVMSEGAAPADTISAESNLSSTSEPAESTFSDASCDSIGVLVHHIPTGTLELPGILSSREGRLTAAGNAASMTFFALREPVLLRVADLRPHAAQGTGQSTQDQHITAEQRWLGDIALQACMDHVGVTSPACFAQRLIKNIESIAPRLNNAEILKSVKDYKLEEEPDDEKARAWLWCHVVPFLPLPASVWSWTSMHMGVELIPQALSNHAGAANSCNPSTNPPESAHTTNPLSRPPKEAQSTGIHIQTRESSSLSLVPFPFDHLSGSRARAKSRGTSSKPSRNQTTLLSVVQKIPKQAGSDQSTEIAEHIRKTYSGTCYTNLVGILQFRSLHPISPALSAFSPDLIHTLLARQSKLWVYCLMRGQVALNIRVMEPHRTTLASSRAIASGRTGAPLTGYRGCSYNFAPSAWKSLLQKNIRRGRAAAAVRCALQLGVTCGVLELVRRVTIIALEDALLPPWMPAMVLLMSTLSSKPGANEPTTGSFGANLSDMCFVLSAVWQLAQVPIRDLDYEDDSDQVNAESTMIRFRWPVCAYAVSPAVMFTPGVRQVSLAEKNIFSTGQSSALLSKLAIAREELFKMLVTASQHPQASLLVDPSMMSNRIEDTDRDDEDIISLDACSVDDCDNDEYEDNASLEEELRAVLDDHDDPAEGTINQAEEAEEAALDTPDEGRDQGGETGFDNGGYAMKGWCTTQTHLMRMLYDISYVRYAGHLFDSHVELCPVCEERFASIPHCIQCSQAVCRALSLQFKAPIKQTSTDDKLALNTHEVQSLEHWLGIALFGADCVQTLDAKLLHELDHPDVPALFVGLNLTTPLRSCFGLTREESDLVKSLLLRASFGGMKLDMEMVRRCAWIWLTRFVIEKVLYNVQSREQPCSSSQAIQRTWRRTSLATIALRVVNPQCELYNRLKESLNSLKSAVLNLRSALEKRILTLLSSQAFPFHVLPPSTRALRTISTLPPEQAVAAMSMGTIMAEAVEMTSSNGDTGSATSTIHTYGKDLSWLGFIRWAFSGTDAGAACLYRLDDEIPDKGVGDNALDTIYFGKLATPQYAQKIQLAEFALWPARSRSDLETVLGWLPSAREEDTLAIRPRFALIPSPAFVQPDKVVEVVEDDLILAAIDFHCSNIGDTLLSQTCTIPTSSGPPTDSSNQTTQTTIGKAVAAIIARALNASERSITVTQVQSAVRTATWYYRSGVNTKMPIKLMPPTPMRIFVRADSPLNLTARGGNFGLTSASSCSTASAYVSMRTPLFWDYDRVCALHPTPAESLHAYQFSSTMVIRNSTDRDGLFHEIFKLIAPVLDNESRRFIHTRFDASAHSRHHF